MTAPGTRSTKTRTRYIVAASGCAVAVVAVIALAIVLSENVMYFRTVSEAVKDRKEEGTDRFRLAGAVVRGSIQDSGRTVRFELTDGKKTVSVVHQGERPVLFKNGAPVLCEGRWSAVRMGAPFASDRILIKHGNEYKAPEVDTKKAPPAEATA